MVEELCTGILSENVDGDLMHDDDYENLLSIDKFLSTTAWTHFEQNSNWIKFQKRMNVCWLYEN